MSHFKESQEKKTTEAEEAYFDALFDLVDTAFKMKWIQHNSLHPDDYARRIFPEICRAIDHLEREYPTMSGKKAIKSVGSRLRYLYIGSHELLSYRVGDIIEGILRKSNWQTRERYRIEINRVLKGTRSKKQQIAGLLCLERWLHEESSILPGVNQE